MTKENNLVIEHVSAHLQWYPLRPLTMNNLHMSIAIETSEHLRIEFFDFGDRVLKMLR